MGAKTLSSDVAFGVDGQLTDRALRALLKHHESSSSETNLLGNDLDVQVQFSLARVPGNASPKPVRIEIPHPLHKVAAAAAEEEDGDYLQDVDACIIVKEESKPWVQDLIGRFPTELGCIKKVLGLQSLRTKHKLFKQRRELLERFDLFFADDRILPMLTKELGGKFFQKKKQPVPVRLTRREALPFAIQKCLSSTFMYLSAGTCVTVKAGNTAMPPAKLLSNIRSICSVVPTKVPRKWSNIRSVSIKTSASVALPIYNKTPEELEAIMKLAKENKGFEEKEEVAEEDGGKRKRKTAAASSDLAKALKKQKAAEDSEKAEKDKGEVIEKPTKTPKKKRKESMDEKEEETTTKPTKSSKKRRKESIGSSDGLDVAKAEAPAKTPKSSKRKNKKGKDSVDEGKKEEEVKKDARTPKLDVAQAEAPAKTPKSSKKKKKGKGSVDEDKKEDEVKKDTKTPKSSKKLESKAEGGTKKTPKKPSDGSSSEDDNFISSKKFSGAKEGYVFLKGKLGIGYYKDALPVVDKGWLSGLGRKAGRGGGGGGRKSMGHGMKKKRGDRSSRRSY